jgi:hypothetical protein
MGHLQADPRTDVVYQPRFLGNRNKLVRSNETALGVLPPDQGFGGNDPVVSRERDGLEVENELVFPDGLLKILSDRKVLLAQLFHPVVIANALVLGIGFGPVECQVSMPHQLVDPDAVFRVMRVADAKPDIFRFAVNDLGR